MSRNTIIDMLSGDAGCEEAHTHSFKKGEMVFINISDTSETAIVLDGTVLIVNISSDGQKSILDICRSGDAFGCGIFPKDGFDACCAIAKTDSVISFISYQKLLDGCEKNCPVHSSFIDNFLGGAARRHALHIDILSRRTIRDKLLAAFRLLLDPHRYTEQKLPLSLSELADYICCDRSAMMREIKHLNNDRFISSHGSRITFLKDISQL